MLAAGLAGAAEPKLAGLALAATGALTEATGLALAALTEAAGDGAAGLGAAAVAPQAVKMDPRHSVITTRLIANLPLLR
ncbi:MAG TPA: hypothetical protein VKU60_19055 [Chloroflexota bacterium]|nr:hypothetical protein [Chloroflexota bacterium]